MVLSTIQVLEIIDEREFYSEVPTDHIVVDPLSFDSSNWDEYAKKVIYLINAFIMHRTSKG